nr:MAG TPA: hypothetical protein [Caudoviricetes sp.]
MFLRVLLSMKNIQMLYMFCVSCQRLQLCSLEVSYISESAAQMPDQSIYGDRGVQIGTNRHFIPEEWSFSVHLEYTSGKPA